MKINDVKPLGQFKLSLSFDNGVSGVVDLSSYAGRGVFSAWNQPGFFEKVAITEQGALEWPGEIDLCPDALYLRMTGRDVHSVFTQIQRDISHA